MPLVTQQKDIY